MGGALMAPVLGPRPLRFLAGLLVAALQLAARPAEARDITIDLTDPIVSITTGFTGTDLLLYGAIKQPGDVIVVVRGPAKDELVRRKKRVAGIWINRDEINFDKVPSFYQVASNRPLKEFLSDDLADRLQIGLDNLDLRTNHYGPLPNDPNGFRDGLIRNMQGAGLYMKNVGDVVFLSEQLFRTRIRFPGNVSVGNFTVEVYLFRHGKLASSATTLLTVRKFGLEAELYDFAHRQAFIYGVLAVIIALVAGWTANAVFRKR